jgi:hypothetical protein
MVGYISTDYTAIISLNYDRETEYQKRATNLTHSLITAPY